MLLNSSIRQVKPCIPLLRTLTHLYPKAILTKQLQYRRLYATSQNETKKENGKNNSTTDKQKADKKSNGRPSMLWPKLKTLTSFTLSGSLILGGIGISAIVLYLIISELFSPSGDTQLFNRAVTMVEKDPTVRDMLQCKDSALRKERLKAYGELITHDRWTRNRPIVSTKKLDRSGITHHFMRFHVESKKKRALVHIEAKDSQTNYQPDFTTVYVDIPGEKRFYLIRPKLAQIVKPTGFLGVNWGPRKS
ncbi:Tim21p NDAI_0D03990 [Naumovozyma dairenensis CBS 421]|uniref:Mitochondrial import inner membrane translocase subunit Tim21 n=1 Tax=Naumovozyma dairenensis (strain ATCC 10597 / BCRC 20456 / CBS 421 / NBRC 0211 / NRRL Y-12639) TaxID=1071378 RepID=G0WAA2_NAUDC|nr:hypothetical protein NDAI_0D03990 [Naumovozyma dairenensis CBS 421]CCD24713.1 hypothetical protein NDAI_0D03990 [Naumovozyma dairenensis CBS 421]